MGLALDFESSTVEGITLRLTSKEGNMFLKNYSHFGWRQISKLSIDGYEDMYSYILERNKNHPNYKQLKALESGFLDLIKDVKMKDSSSPLIPEKINPDYLDYASEKPLMEEFKLTTGTIVFNTVCCFILIGFLMWADTAKKLLIDNKKAKKYNDIQVKVKEIFRKADALL